MSVKDGSKFGLAGLVINTIGALFLAYSLKGGNGYITSSVTGNHFYIAHISEIAFKIGVLLFVLGFVLQILERVWKEDFGKDIRIFSVIITAVVYIVVAFNFLAERVFFR